MEYISVIQFAEKYGISERTARNYCAQGKIEGAFLTGKTWNIPADAVLPKRGANKKISTLLKVLKEQKASRLKGSIYHRTQIDLTYNSNHIEGSKLTHDQTRYIFETNTIGITDSAVNVDDIVETVNHFRCIDYIIDHADERLTEDFIKHLDGKELQLIFLYKYKNQLVHKDAVSACVRQYIPTAALDQQVRHLGSQLGWNVLNKGSKIPDKNVKIPSGYNYLVSLETPNPKNIANALKRAGRLAAKNFNELKLAYENKCATCGIEEGKKDPRDGSTVSLQQGHMNPRKSLTLDNTIPQCSYCNQTYQDYFVFNEFGRVIEINNPQILLKSPRNIQDEMIQVLLEERKKTQS